MHFIPHWPDSSTPSWILCLGVCVHAHALHVNPQQNHSFLIAGEICLKTYWGLKLAWVQAETDN